ncbi:MAG TPA: hypothetical protein VD993_08250 [Chitinophagaceae bacterium]|nr:hypothetical protein [Chitinophagaceae bacterium]
MRKTFLFASAILLASFNLTYGQQWSGSSGTTGTITRSGVVDIQGESNGLIVDADGSQRMGFMKYATTYAGIWRTSDAWFEIGRVTSGTLTSPSARTVDFFIHESGKVGIGTTAPGSFKLAVEGKIGAREIRVTLTNPWPDYVFSNQYKLRSLPSLEEFIKKHGHLPNMPTAQEVKDNGIELGDMSGRLLEKIEELTLYMIELKKENEQIKQELKKLKGN